MCDLSLAEPLRHCDLLNRDRLRTVKDHDEAA
jgi:hypothetical protein